MMRALPAEMLGLFSRSMKVKRGTELNRFRKRVSNIGIDYLGTPIVTAQVFGGRSNDQKADEGNEKQESHFDEKVN